MVWPQPRPQDAPRAPGKVPLRATTAMRPGDAVIVKYKGKKRHETREDAGTDSLEDDAAQMPEG